MRVSVRVRALAIGVAAGSLVAVPLATPASATTPHVACSKLVAKTTISGTGANSKATTKSTLSVCTPSALSAGATSTVTTPVSNTFGKVTSKLTWKNGKGTTTVVQQYKTTTTPGKCPNKKGWLHIKLTGTTKTSTGAAAKIIKAGETISGSICTNTNTTPYTSTLEPGTKFKL